MNILKEQNRFRSQLVKLAKSLVVVFACALPLGRAAAQQPLTVNLEQEQGRTCLALKNAAGSLLTRITLGLTTSTQDFASGLILKETSAPVSKTESYTNVHGKKREVSCPYTEQTFTLVNSQGSTMKVETRLFSDGLAFRYVLPVKKKVRQEFTGESTAYYIASDSRRWLQKFVPSYEGDFPLQEKGGKTGAWNYPALFETSGTFLLITEANASRMYCTTHLDNSGDADIYKVSYPFDWEGCGQGAVNPVWTGPWTSPWRVVIAGTLADIVESTMVYNVSDPCTLTDTSWIHPGRAAWVYWAYNHGTKDYQICKQYVDLAAEMGWEYVLFDWEWDAMTNGGKLEDAVAYALSKGVKPWMWYNSGGKHTGVRATPLDRMLTHKNRMEEFAWLKKLGVVGVKVDFFESDKQMMMDYYLDILKDAASVQMMVNFHGCTLPRGWSRTYPHLMSQEAVYGAEQYNNSPYMTPNGSRINCLLPYTRNVVGPMDYTPVAFTNSQHPHITSYAHELALSVAFESGLQHWADRPEGFRQLPEEARRHMMRVPVVWDETHFVSGYPGRSFVVARRSGKTWYVAGLNGQPRPAVLQLDYSFLKSRTGKYTVFSDGEDATKMEIDSSDFGLLLEDKVSVPCLPHGGFLMVFEEN